jgi:folate-binding protein YgfZ
MLGGMATVAPAGADALADGSAFTVLEGWRLTRVRGADAIAWLNDLMTADLAAVGLGDARRSLLLTATGRLRADARIVRIADGAELLEAPEVSDPIGRLLAPYVLSSDVSIAEPEPVLVLAVPSARAVDVVAEAVADAGTSTLVTSRPSLLGDGIDVIGDGPTTARLAEELLTRGLRPADVAAADALRVARGLPRWAAELRPGDLPVGLGVDDALADAKGCYLGQEAVAKIRNLGHPPLVLRHLRSARPVEVGASVRTLEGPVGEVTSVAEAPPGAVLLARVRWGAGDAPLRLDDGSPLIANAGAPSPRPLGPRRLD